MEQEQDEILKAQQIIATSVEIAKSLPEYEGDTDVDQFNIHLGQFVEMTKIDLKVLKSMLLLRLRGKALTFLKQIENTIGTEATSTIKSIELLQQAFQKRFTDTSLFNELVGMNLFWKACCNNSIELIVEVASVPIVYSICFRNVSACPFSLKSNILFNTFRSIFVISTNCPKWMLN